MVNRQDEKLGNIHDLVIDAKDDRLLYVVFSIGDFLGMVDIAVRLALESLRIPPRKCNMQQR
jgi:hypothetical protein